MQSFSRIKRRYIPNVINLSLKGFNLNSRRTTGVKEHGAINNPFRVEQNGSMIFINSTLKGLFKIGCLSSVG